MTIIKEPRKLGIKQGVKHPHNNLLSQRNQARISMRRSAVIMHNEQVHQATVINLSLKGAGVITNVELEQGARIHVRFSIPGYQQSTPLTLSGEVVRSTIINKKRLLGVKFSSLNLHQQFVITGFISFQNRLD